MTTATIIVQVGAAVLVGWPTLKLAAALASRPLWRKLRALRVSLEADPAYGPLDQHLIRDVSSLAFGDLTILAAPAMIPAFATILAYMPRTSSRMSEATKKTHERYKAGLIQAYVAVGYDVMTFNDHLEKDLRFVKMERMAFAISFMRYPVAAIISIPFVAVLIWPALLYKGYDKVFKAVSSDAIAEFVRFGLSHRVGRTRAVTV